MAYPNLLFTPKGGSNTCEQAFIHKQNRRKAAPCQVAKRPPLNQTGLAQRGQAFQKGLHRSGLPALELACHLFGVCGAKFRQSAAQRGDLFGCAETDATGQGMLETTDDNAGEVIAAVWAYVKGILDGKKTVAFDGLLHTENRPFDTGIPQRGARFRKRNRQSAQMRSGLRLHSMARPINDKGLLLPKPTKRTRPLGDCL